MRILIFLIFPFVTFAVNPDSLTLKIPPRPAYQDYENVSGPFKGALDPIYKDDPSYVKQFIQGGTPRVPLLLALDFYYKNIFMFDNKETITVINLTTHSTEQRMFMLNMSTGSVARYLVSHGSGGDSNHDGYVDKNGLSNTPDSKMSSKGAYLTIGEYDGKYGRSVRLIGLEFSNSNAFARDIVMHPADYVSPEAIDDNEQSIGKRVLGRSAGCPAIDYEHRDEILDTIANGSLLYIYGEGL
jgi:hypothetical protein